MRNGMSKAIGGYFALELPVAVYPLPQHAIRFQSARAAFHALLNVGQPPRVWMPKYICDAMLAPLHALGIEIIFYDLDQRLGVVESVTLAPQHWLLYVNYFGLPDGGLLHTDLNVSEPEQLDSGSVGRCTHLLQRLDTTAEDGYADFQRAEESLDDTQPRSMSSLSMRLLAGIDHETIKHRRNKNFNFLH